VDFHIREITQGSKKKTYGPYEGYIEKLKEPIELKGRVIKYKPFAKLIRGKSVKKGGMFRPSAKNANSEMVCIHDRNFEGKIHTTRLRIEPDKDIWARYEDGKPIILEHGEKVIIINRNIRKNPEGDEYFYVIKENRRADGFGGLVKAKYIKCSNPSVNSSNNLLSEFQPNNKAKYRRPPTSLPGLRGQSAYNQRKSTSLSEFSGESANNQRQLIGLSGFSEQSSRYNQPLSATLSANFGIEKLYNSVDNLELFKSITGHKIPNVFIPKGQVVDVLENVKHFNDKYNKIRVLTSKGYIEGYVNSDSLKKTRWLCNHRICLEFNGQYDKDQFSNKTIPVTVANILRNKQGEILVGTETDFLKMSQFNKFRPGFHLCAGMIHPDSCPVNSSYDAIAEESRFLPVEKRGKRNFTLWDSIFKRDGNYKIKPWLSSGRAIVFVGEIGNIFWDESEPPYGKEQTFTNPNQLDKVFEELRKTLQDNKEKHKYLEKINFKWVKPLPKGSSVDDWNKWSMDNQMYEWGRNIIQDYVEHSTEPAQLEPRLENSLNFLPPPFSSGMSASSNKQSAQPARLFGGPAQSRHRTQGNNGQSASLSGGPAQSRHRTQGNNGQSASLSGGPAQSRHRTQGNNGQSASLSGGPAQTARLFGPYKNRHRTQGNNFYFNK
jgi:hypothetical protein